MEFDQSIINQQLQSLVLELSHLSCFNPFQIETVSVIATGLSHPCFYVKYENNAYFAKYVMANSTEPLASQLAATHSISPKLIYLAENWLITEFLVGEGLDQSHQSEEEKLIIMLSLLARCHRIDHNNDNQQSLVQTISLIDEQVPRQQNIPELDIAATVSQLLKNIALSSVQEHTLKALIKVLQQNLAKQKKTMPNPKQVFCHGDANFSNVIQLENNIKNSEPHYQLLDFECACIAPIEYDLAMLLAVNEIDSNKVDTINVLYQQAFSAVNQQKASVEIVDNLTAKTQATAKVSLFMVTCYLDLSYLINALWYISKFQDDLQSKYKTLAVKQLRLLALRHPQANVFLDEMR